MSIEIGQTYKDFEGNSVKIVSFMKYDNKKYPFIGVKQCNGKEYSYNKNGEYLESKQDQRNLILKIIMKKYTFKILAVKKGSIGKRQKFTLTVEAENFQNAQYKLYDTHEHIQILSVNGIKPNQMYDLELLAKQIDSPIQ